MAGYRNFVTGEVLTAANVNQFLMEQAVMTFADDAARTAALAGVLREGMLSYNLAEGRLEVYDGNDWVEPAPEPPAPPAGIGSNVVQTVKTDEFTASIAAGDNYEVITGLEATITPSSNTSKVLVIVSIMGAAREGAKFLLKRGTTELGLGDAAGSRTRTTFSGGNMTTQTDLSNNNYTFLDEPNTDVPTTYTVEVGTNQGGTVGVFINRSETNGNSVNFGRPSSTITLIEVAA